MIPHGYAPMLRQKLPTPDGISTTIETHICLRCGSLVPELIDTPGSLWAIEQHDKWHKDNDRKET